MLIRQIGGTMKLLTVAYYAIAPAIATLRFPTVIYSIAAFGSFAVLQWRGVQKALGFAIMTTSALTIIVMCAYFCSAIQKNGIRTEAEYKAFMTTEKGDRLKEILSSHGSISLLMVGLLLMFFS